MSKLPNYGILVEYLQQISIFCIKMTKIFRCLPTDKVLSFEAVPTYAKQIRIADFQPDDMFSLMIW